VGDNPLVVGLHTDMVADAIGSGYFYRCGTGQRSGLNAGLIEDSGTCSGRAHDR
jgi:hypothetical protein